MPNSLLAVAASIHGKRDYELVDGNLDPDPWQTISHHLATGRYGYFAVTVMPGPALKQAIPFSRSVRTQFPQVIIIWGGYFPSNHPAVCLQSGYVDYVVHGPGDKAFPALLSAIESNGASADVPNLVYRDEQHVIRHTPKDALYDQDTLAPLPYERLHQTYPLRRYLPRTYLGEHTLAYHSSMGCPFTCSFCAVVPIYNARWKGRSARLIYDDINSLRKIHDIDAVEFHDNNFFVSEKRVAEFSKLILHEGLSWWGEARIDTVDKFSDATLSLMKQSGCKMIFFGAESGDDAVLKRMDKGGTQTGEQILRFAGRLARFGIIPEYSFVLGTPAATEAEVNSQIDRDIAFIREVKRVNPQTEIIIYTYSPVPVEGSEMYNTVKAQGFRFPEKLEDWISPAWESFDLRKNPLTPWLKPYMIDKIKSFETVLNGYYPTVSDLRMRHWQKRLMRGLSAARYHGSLYGFPYEIKALQKIWRYRQPEKEGF